MEDEPEGEGLIGVNAASRLAGKSINALQGAISRGELRRTLSEGKMLFNPADVLSWKQARESGWDQRQREIEESQERARVQDQEARERLRSSGRCREQGGHRTGSGSTCSGEQPDCSA